MPHEIEVCEPVLCEPSPRILTTQQIACQFKLGFWHTFGEHGGGCRDEIIARKTREIRANGYTLWSFQLRRTLEAWLQEIQRIGNPGVFVFCSDSPKAELPASPAKDCNGYRMVSDDSWRRIPKAANEENSIRVPHHFPHTRTEASAFVVKGIYPAEGLVLPAVQWFSRRKALKERESDPWYSNPVPTRPGETMIRLGGNDKTRNLRVRAILELKAPYLALVGIKPLEELSEEQYF